MVGQVNWMVVNQPTKDGGLSMQGNSVGDGETVASAGTSAVAPTGAQYASISCDVASTVVATFIQGANASQTALFSGNSYKCGAGEVFQIPNITVGSTTITVTDI